MAAEMAQRAASSGVEALARTVLIDANRGQGSIRKVLRVTTAGLPSVYDAAISGDARRALVIPSQVNAARADRLGALAIAVILAPTDDQADPRVVTAEVYRRAIDHARAQAGLVVIDTQSVEAWDTSGLIDDLVIPLLAGGAWGLGLADDSTEGLDNLIRRMARFQTLGVNSAHLMVGLNRLQPDAAHDLGQLRSTLAPYATLMGAAHEDNTLPRALDAGRLPHGGSFVELLDAVLARVTGLSQFAPTPASRQSGSKGSRSPFTRRRKG